MAQINDSQEQVTVNVETLQPVTRTLMTIGALPTSYLISMTYEEQLLWLQNYLTKTVIPAINNNAEATKEVQDIVMALQQYINDYFNNLDVQEEINNKLDELLADGTLERLIGAYIDPLIEAQNQEISNFKTSVNGQIATQNAQIQAVESGSPLVASSVAGMTDTTRVYVNTTDGKWYYYNGTNWVAGGVYQSAETDKYLDDSSNNALANATITEYINYLTNNAQSKSMKYKNSNLDLKFNNIIPLKFTNGTYTNKQINHIPDAERAITDFKNIEGKIYIYNFGNILYDFLEIDSEGEINYRKNHNYPLTPYFEYNCSSDYKYLFMIKNNENTTISNIDRVNAEKYLYVFQEPIEETDFYSLIKDTNLFKNANDGSFVRYENGVIQSNPAMCLTDYLNVKPREILYENNVYVQLAFYDYNKNYISGFYNNPALNEPTTPYQKIVVPDGAFYMIASTRIANKHNIVISNSFLPIISKSEKMLPVSIPKYLIKNYDDNKYLYDIDLTTGYTPNEIEKTNTTISNLGAVINSNGYIKYNKYICLDKSITSFIFKCTQSSVLQFGNDISEYNPMIDAGLKVEIDTSNQLMRAYSSDWDQNNILKGTTNIPFNVADGSRYCLKITKDTIYNVTIELYNADCFTESAKINILTEKGATTVSTLNMARVWGCGRAGVSSGSMTLLNMSMISTGNEYSKIFVIGDSYVENFSRPYDCSYARQLYDILEGNVFISGAGGNTSSAILRRLINELPYVHPDYVIVNTGVNDRNITQEKYEENITAIINILNSFELTPVLVTCPRVMDQDNLTVMTYINEFVRNSGYKYIDLAMALSTGDGITMDTSKYKSDLVHPNEAGANAIIKWIETNLSELLF